MDVQQRNSAPGKRRSLPLSLFGLLPPARRFWVGAASQSVGCLRRVGQPIAELPNPNHQCRQITFCLQRHELVTLQAYTAATLEQEQQQQRQQLNGAGSPPAGDPSLADGGGSSSSEGLPTDSEGQPLLHYSVRSMQPQGLEPPPLAGPRLEEDPLPIQHDPTGRLLGQVNSVEAGRVHGFACLKGAPGAELAVTVYVDGVLAGHGQASLPTQTQAVRRLCQLDGAASNDAAAAAAGQPHVGRDGSGSGVGFVVPLPPLPQGLHTVSMRSDVVGVGRCIAPPAMQFANSVQ